MSVLWSGDTGDYAITSLHNFETVLHPHFLFVRGTRPSPVGRPFTVRYLVDHIDHFMGLNVDENLCTTRQHNRSYMICSITALASGIADADRLTTSSCTVQHVLR